MKKAAWIVSITLLLVTGFFGLYNGRNELGDWTTALQMSVTLGVLLYGFLGLLGGAGLARRRSWSVTVCIAWAFVVTYVATVASFAYSDPTFQKSETVLGTIAAAVSCALLGVFVVWSARSATRVPVDAASLHIPPS